jgi:cardiolipin synthase
VFNVPNALSMARLISGPFVAYFILHGYWATAMGTLAVAGLSDWADGYAAKHYGQTSVLGSYLDPLADKVLVGCTVGALAAEVIFCLT